MELDKIKKLLEKYVEGETTLGEERLLKNYFSSGNVAPDLQKYRPMFEAFQVRETDMLKSKLRFKKRNYHINWLTIAASLLLFFYSKKQYDNYIVKKQFAEVKKALKEVSVNLNKGEIAMIELHKVNKILEK